MIVNKTDNSTVNELINKATEIFSMKGYEGTHLTDITDELGLSRGPVYYHFKDKFGLYKASYEKYEDEVRTSHYKRVSENKHIIHFIEDVIFDCLSRTTRYNSNFFFGIETISELKEIKEKYQKLSTDIYKEKLFVVNRAMDKREIRRTVDPKQMVDLMYMIYLGLLNSVELNILKDYSESEIRNLVRILLIGFEEYYCL